MKRVTALLLDDNDFTRDGNIRRSTFEAICTHEVVLYGDQVVKNRYGEITQTLPAMRGKLAMPGQQALDLSSPPEAALTEEDDASSTPPNTETPRPNQADSEVPRFSAERSTRTPNNLPEPPQVQEDAP